jgi:AraC-like DNA-binding protein
MTAFYPYKNFFYNQFHGMSNLVVTTVGHEQSSPGFVHLPDVRKSYTLHFCVKGKGVLRANNLSFPVSVGDVMLIYPNVKIRPQADRKDPWHLYWVGFTGSEARLLTDAIGFSPLKPVIPISHQNWDKTRDAFLDVYEGRGDSPAQIIQMTGKLYCCIAYLMTQTSNPFPRSSGFEYVETACAFIAENYHKRISVLDIAEAAGVSRSCLYRSFVANLSMSPLEYLTDYRIKASCALLDRKNLPLKEIAFLCGFSNALYFSQVFKSVMGISPSLYLKHVSDKNNAFSPSE